jgi:hypothetical protein
LSKLYFEPIVLEEHAEEVDKHWNDIRPRHRDHENRD